MASRDLSQELISKLTVTPEQDLGEMIRDLTPPKPSAISRDSSTSSIGRLDVLPKELLLEILNLLDFQSLSRISRTSLKGKAVIEAQPSYRDFMKHCPEILAALAQTQLLQLHSSGLLRQTLLAGKCASCFEFGAFFFLPTCERICFECLCRNYAYRMTDLRAAKIWFGLTDAQVRTIPILRSIPGHYHVRNISPWQRPSSSLVCIKHVRHLALEVHGSPEKVASFMPEGLDHPISFQDFHIVRQFHEAPLEPPGYDLSRNPDKTGWIRDKYPGMASIRMPSLSSSGADYGRLCQGCRHMSDLHSLSMLPSDVLAEMVPGGKPKPAPLLATLTRLWSRDGFVGHIGRCYGAGRLLNEWGEDR